MLDKRNSRNNIYVSFWCFYRHPQAGGDPEHSADSFLDSAKALLLVTAFD
jgi:hypothetical protein